ncbi:hypothetical protein D9613_011288 [Agrocybe pediades]|uniref:J domain-containing protein n=1 Tax=Agrocybe pediades TaxID=84607 RepID=A0A8H4VNB1_9AGAR|nr:hypothetical protein D9613_011288 [Agrocybe pediades]
MTRLSHLLQPSTQLLTRIFKLSYFLPPSSPSPVNPLKQCLHYDPDSKSCLKLRRMLKALEKSFTKLDELQEKEDWRSSVKLLLTKEDQKDEDLWQRREDALIEQAGDEMELLPLIPPTLVQASMLVQASSTTTAKKSKKTPQIHLSLASKVSPQHQRRSSLKRGQDFRAGVWEQRAIHQRPQRAQKLLKQSKQKDYYETLDISRDADLKPIQKAYRKQAKKAHPYKGGSEVKMALALLNDAFEVLSITELRQRFENRVVEDSREDEEDSSKVQFPF